MKLDSLDISILKLLQKDAKLTNKALSSKLSLSVTAIYERIKKLEKSGIIDNYVALVSKEKVEKLICSSFRDKKKISNVLISHIPQTLELNDLTYDKRHLKSLKIKLKNYKEICIY